MTRKTVILPSFERLHTVLAYDPATGLLHWKRRDDKDFENRKYPADRLAASWNNKNAHKVAFTNFDPNGYLAGGIDGRTYKAARVIWKMMTDREPDTIDHIDGCRTNNRWVNLRNGTPLQNQRNLKLISTNISGQMGVRWNKRFERWHAYIGVSGRNVFLGYFSTREEAIAARQAAERLHNFDPAHGRR